jgi:hypothetical protein
VRIRTEKGKKAKEEKGMMRAQNSWEQKLPNGSSLVLFLSFVFLSFVFFSLFAFAVLFFFFDRR